MELNCDIAFAINDSFGVFFSKKISIEEVRSFCSWEFSSQIKMPTG